jgi:hypothetical protein
MSAWNLAMSTWLFFFSRSSSRLSSSMLMLLAVNSPTTMVAVELLLSFARRAQN